MIELIKNLNTQGYPQRMRLQRQLKTQYDDSKFKLSFLKCSIFMEYLMIWQRRKPVDSVNWLNSCR